MESKTNYDIDDSQIVYMINENSDDAKNYLFEKYSPMIHKEINKVKNSAYALNVDFADLSQEAMLAFSNAINSYNPDEEVKFITFATMCVKRKISNYLKKHSTQKSNIEKNALPLEMINDVTSETLLDSIKDSDVKDPLNKLILDETILETNQNVKVILSPKEKEALIYSMRDKSIQEISILMNLNVKQVYNLLHRARNKLKNINKNN